MAGKNFAKAKVDDRVNLIAGDAAEVVKGLEPGFDLIFMDIEKNVYAPILEILSGCIRPGGLLFVDNTGFSDAHSFNQMIWQSPEWESVQILARLPGHSPEEDGICMAVKV